jgi:asparagine synthase (glutamine-hydrolysing)
MSASLCAGRPRFADPSLAGVCEGEGAQAAWLLAWRRDGAQAPTQVAGDFAVALQDERGRVFMAVDRFAMRTLCYRIDGGQLRFAERADALADSAADLDPQALFDYLFFHVIPSPRTVYRGIYRLPPGHCAVFENGQLTVQPYWTPAFDEQHGRPFADLRDAFRGLVEASVRTQLAGADTSRVGCYLSGGTDSSTVAGMVGRVTGRAARTYSIGFDAAGYDEMEYARIAARHFGTEHHEYYVTPEDLVRDIPTVAAAYDQPFGNSSALPAYCCARFARADGIDRMLAGDGGDELFGGNTRYAMQRIFGWYDAVPAVLRTHLMEPLLRQRAAGKVRLLRRASGYVNQAKVPLPDRLQMFNLLLRLGVDEVLAPGFLRRVDLDGPARDQRAVWAQVKQGSQINRMLAYDWRYTLAENDLPKVCRTASLAGAEVGFPFLDDALLAFSQRLPSEYKLKGLTLRWFFKEALRGFLPDEIIAKKKHGFGLPFGQWATQHAALKRLAEDSLASLAQRGIVRPGFVRTLIGERLAEGPGYYGEMVWILMMLEQWLQAHAPDFRVDT